MIVRRTAILIAALSSIGLCEEFWNTKAPAAWSEKEVERILTRSPWTRAATSEFKPRGMRQGGEMPPPGGGPPMGEGQAGPGPGGMGGPGGGGPGGPREFNARVRWESARPVREALKERLPKDYDGYYVIAVHGLPQMRRPRGQQEGGPNIDPDQMRKRMVERMKESTTLSRKGKDPAKPERIETTTVEDASIFLFFFPRGEAPITLEDKELTFATQFGPMEMKATFPLKEMLYQGKLEL
jgi:hypothetical protein